MKIIEHEVTFLEQGKFEESVETFKESEFRKYEGTPLEIINEWYESWNNSESNRQRQRVIQKIRKITTVVKSEILFKDK